MLNRLKDMSYWNITIAIALGVTVAVGPSCASKFVNVNTPQGAVDKGVPAVLNVEDSIESFEEFNANYLATAEPWAARIGVAQEKVAFWDGMFAQALQPETLALFGLNPVTGVGASALYILGLFTKRPRDKSPAQVAAEKEASFNEAQERTAKLIRGT